MKDAGYTASDMKSSFLLIELKKLGYTATDMHSAGYGCAALRSGKLRLTSKPVRDQIMGIFTS
jgi:hypothetical protein